MEFVRMLTAEPILWESLVLVVALIMGTHYMVSRHNLWLGIGEREQKVIGRYVTGTLSIGIPFTFLGWDFNLWLAVILYWLCAGVAGVATLIFYRLDVGLDKSKEARAQLKDAVTKAAMSTGDGK